MKKIKFFYIDLAKEEKWIAKMQEKGYQLSNVWPSWGLYEFLPSEEEQTVRIDFRQFKKDEEFQEYLTLFEDSGWQHLGGSRQHGCQYFVRTRADAGETLLSDKESKAGMYRRLADFWSAMFWPFLALGIAINQSTGVWFLIGYALFCGYLSMQARRWAKIEVEGITEKI